MYVLCAGFATSDVDESIPRDGTIFAVEAEVEQSALPVTVVKLIADVPAQRTKLLSLLRHMQNKMQNEAMWRDKHACIHKHIQ